MLVMAQLKKQQAEEDHGTCVQMLDDIPTGCILLQSDGLICYANQAANYLFQGDLVGHSWLDIIKSAIANISSGGQYITLTNGKIVAIKTQSVAYLNCQLLLLIDITDAQKEINHKHKIDSLQNLDKLSSALAHQLKTPLTTAFLHLDTLNQLTRGTTATDRMVHQISSKLKAQLTQIQQLIDSELSLLQTTDFKVDKINLLETIKTILNDYKLVYPEITFCLAQQSSEPSIYVYGHQAALTSAIQSIIDNAVEASNAQGQIDCSIHDDESNLLINVIDYGAGIPSHTLNKIETPYFTTKRQGTGLGLPIAKAILKAHQGHLCFASNSEYTVFTLSLPIAKEES